MTKPNWKIPLSVEEKYTGIGLKKLGLGLRAEEDGLKTTGSGIKPVFFRPELASLQPLALSP